MQRYINLFTNYFLRHMASNLPFLLFPCLVLRVVILTERCHSLLRYKKKNQNKKNLRADWKPKFKLTPKKKCPFRKKHQAIQSEDFSYTITCNWNCKSLEIDADYQHNGQQYRNGIKLKRRTNFIKEHRLTQLTNFATQQIKTNGLILWPMRKYFLHA